jgi:two-component SAPR family response regulator
MLVAIMVSDHRSLLRQSARTLGKARWWMMRNVVLVEDQGLVALDLEDMLHALGIKRVRIVSGERKARHELMLDRPDLLITDIRLDGGNGIALARWARELYPTLPTIFASASAHDVEDPRFEVKLEKPVSPGDLLRAMQRLAVLPPVHVVPDMGPHSPYREQPR